MLSFGAVEERDVGVVTSGSGEREFDLVGGASATEFLNGVHLDPEGGEIGSLKEFNYARIRMPS